jgi:hypothetical protein
VKGRPLALRHPHMRGRRTVSYSSKRAPGARSCRRVRTISSFRHPKPSLPATIYHRQERLATYAMSANLNDDNANGKNPVRARPLKRPHSSGDIRDRLQLQQNVSFGRDSERGTSRGRDRSYKQPSEVSPESTARASFQSQVPFDYRDLQYSDIEPGPREIAINAANDLISFAITIASSCYRQCVSSILPQSEKQSGARL